MNTYSKNKCSHNATKVADLKHEYLSDLWADQHYHIRLTEGDENGLRDGIEFEHVKRLIEGTFHHFISYAIRYGDMINFSQNGNNNKRVVLKNIDDEEEHLSVAIEYHFINVNSFEITIFTAMKVKDFFIREGQYVIEMHHNKTKLYRLIQKELRFKQELEVL
jgi:hypothetical protein